MEKKFKKASESAITISELMLPSHSNFSGKIHGGYILSLLDQIAFACASKHSEHYCVTASVDKVNFLNPIEVGELVTMQANINYVGRSSMVVGVRVEAENIQNKTVKHCNSSYFTMVALDESGGKVQVPGLILENDDQIRRFVRSLKRQKSMHERKAEFTESDFDADAYIDELKDQNILLMR